MATPRAYVFRVNRWNGRTGKSLGRERCKGRVRELSMSKTDVLEERWTAVGEYIHLEDGDELCHLRGPAWSQDRNEDRAKLMAAAPAMARLLEKLEHVRLPEMSFSRCPSCLSPCDLSQPHEDGCEWELALRMAGLR